MFANDATTRGYEGEQLAIESASGRPVRKTVDERADSIDELYERDARLLRGAAMLER